MANRTLHFFHWFQWAPNGPTGSVLKDVCDRIWIDFHSYVLPWHHGDEVPFSLTNVRLMARNRLLSITQWTPIIVTESLSILPIIEAIISSKVRVEKFVWIVPATNPAYAVTSMNKHLKTRGGKKDIPTESIWELLRNPRQAFKRLVTGRVSWNNEEFLRDLFYYLWYSSPNLIDSENDIALSSQHRVDLVNTLAEEIPMALIHHPNDAIAGTLPYDQIDPKVKILGLVEWEEGYFHQPDPKELSDVVTRILNWEDAFWKAA